MKGKILAVLASIRFWIITFGWLSAYLAGVSENGFNWIDLFDQVSKWLGSVGLIGTADKYVKVISDGLAAWRKPVSE